MGQGAFPLSLAPTAWRTPLYRALDREPLSFEDFRAEVGRRETRLLRDFRPSEYLSLGEEEALAGCDRLLDTVLVRLGLTPGRKVGKVKPMGPLTTLLGLSYGGPAFHDPFFGELAMVPDAAHPAPRYWRLLGTCHEAAHAKGFTREVDAEILTQLALDASRDIRLRALADIMYLRKSGELPHLPPYLTEEIQASRERLREAQSRQPLVRLLKRLSRSIGFQNSGGKYGTRGSKEGWDPRHKFFATVASALPKVEGVLEPYGP